MNILFWILKVIVWLPISILLPTHIKNRKKFIKGKAIVVANHQSNFDPIVMANFFWRRMIYLAKKELMQNKFTKWFFAKKLGAIPVDRQSVDISTIKESLKVLKNEKTLVIFPEGGRREDSFNDDIKNGTAMFALKTGAPIVPMFFVKKPKFFRFNKLVVGDPIYLDENLVGKASKENIELVSKMIEAKMLEMKEKYAKKKKTKKDWNLKLSSMKKN